MFRNTELDKQYRRLETLFQTAKAFEPDDEIRAHLAKYLCVLCSGFIENSLYYTLCDIVDEACEPSIVLNFTKNHLEKIPNARPETIQKTVGLFNPIWKERIKSFMQENNRRGAIDSIINNRNNIAHGKNSDITISELEKYIGNAIQVIIFIENDMIK